MKWQDPQQFMIFFVGKLRSWAEDKERNLVSWVHPDPTPKTRANEQAELINIRDVIYKFDQLLRLAQTTHDADTLGAHAESVRQYLKGRVKYDGQSFVHPGDPTAIYHEAQTNMEGIFTCIDEYNRTGEMTWY